MREKKLFLNKILINLRKYNFNIINKYDIEEIEKIETIKTSVEWFITMFSEVIKNYEKNVIEPFNTLAEKAKVSEISMEIFKELLSKTIYHHIMIDGECRLCTSNYKILYPLDEVAKYAGISNLSFPSNICMVITTNEVKCYQGYGLKSDELSDESLQIAEEYNIPIVYKKLIYKE